MEILICHVVSSLTLRLLLINGDVQDKSTAPDKEASKSHDKTATSNKDDVSKVKSCTGEFLWKIFITQKPGGYLHLIFNLKQLNEFLLTDNFKLDKEKTVHRIISSGCYIASLDLEDTYYSIPVTEIERKFLRFMFLGILYEYTYLQFDLSTASYTLQPLSHWVINS